MNRHDWWFSPRYSRFDIVMIFVVFVVLRGLVEIFS